MSRIRLNAVAVMGIASSITTGASVLAQCELQKLTASDANGSCEDFGFSVSVSDNVAAIGAQADDNASPGDPNCISGSAYVFRRIGATWVEEQKLTASDAECGDHFGAAVSISSINGHVVAVGAWGKSQGSWNACGAAYMFRWNGSTWIQEQKLTSADPSPGDGFGASISVSGATVIVGEPGDDCGAGDHCGSAYVYEFNGNDWTQEAKLTASDGMSQDRFGTSVAISESYVVVGATGDDDEGDDSGSAYVFGFYGGNWLQEAKLAPSALASGDHFGMSVFLDGNTIIAGADQDDCVDGPDCGSAYIFRRGESDWIQEDRLVASDASQDDCFGKSVSIQGDIALVGAINDDCAGGSACGAAYLFAQRQRNSTGFQRRFLGGDRQARGEYPGRERLFRSLRCTGRDSSHGGC